MTEEPRADDIERLLGLTHPNPHSILGAHLLGRGAVIRAYRPDAQSITAVLDDGERKPLPRRDPRGLFEATLTGRRELFGYQLEIERDDGSVLRTRDPYNFLPTVGELDLHLWREEKHQAVYQKLGAHVRTLGAVDGVAFVVWAPSAKGVSVIGDWNGWDGRLHTMRSLGDFGLWELFIPQVTEGALYKYEIHIERGLTLTKTDPFAQAMEVPPRTASIVYQSKHTFGDAVWMRERATVAQQNRPISIYEVHLGSWRRVPEEGNRSLTYRELAPLLASYVTEMGFTHVELMPVMEHPFSGSWGYQVSGFFAPTSRFGTPDDFRYFVDYLHQHGVGVILDWVPAHFPKDDFALGRFDGTGAFEHLDPKQGEHPDWGTYIFNYGRREVRNFLVSNALFWLSEFHIDGLRIDAVASMLYLDYSRTAGNWVPNAHGGRENLEAIAFLKEVNRQAYEHHPGILMIAEDSTSWPGVSRPTYLGGLGFGFKWNMGWMHDTLDYFAMDPIYRRYHHRKLTFGMMYAWSENFVLPLSHDEVVHEKRSLLSKMPGDRWQRFANLRALLGYQWAHPGKKLLFMGGEFGQWQEWAESRSLDWHLLESADHCGLSRLVSDMNRVYRATPALWEADSDPSGFRWVDADNADDNVLVFLRYGRSGAACVVCICNFSPRVRNDYRIGVPARGHYAEILNTDSSIYGGSNCGNLGGRHTDDVGAHGFAASLSLQLPPLSVLWFQGNGW